MSRDERADAAFVISPRGPLVEKLFGWTLVLSVFVLARFLAVSWPRGEVAEEDFSSSLRVAIETAQHLLAHVSITDLPAIIGATLASEPVPALLLVAMAGYGVCLSTFPNVTFGDDLVSWRASLMLLVTGTAVFGAVLLTAWPWRLLVIGVTALFVAALVSWWGRGAAIARWGRRADALLVRRDGRGRFVDWQTGMILYEQDGPLRFRQIAKILSEDTAHVHRELKARHDEALKDNAVTDAYLEAMLLRRILALEDSAHRRGRALTPARVERSLTCWHLVGWARHAMLTSGVVLTGALLIINLAVTPTSWIAPTCLAEDGTTSTVYILSNAPPTVLDDASRTVDTRTSWDGVDLSTGECARVADAN